MSKPYEIRTNDIATAYYEDILWKVIRSTFKVEKKPATWRSDILLNRLIREKKLVVASTEIGVVYSSYSPAKVSWDGGFGSVMVTSSFFDGGEYVIFGEDKDAVVLDVILPFNDIVDHYAVELSEAVGGVLTSITNSKIAHIFECDGDNAVRNAKAAVEKIHSGSPAVFINSKLAKFTENPSIAYNPVDVSRSYIADKLLDAQEVVYSQFLRDIGIPSITHDKKERLTSRESSINSGISSGMRSMIQDGLNEATSDIKRLFNVDLSINAMVYQKGSEINDNMAVSDVHTTE